MRATIAVTTALLFSALAANAETARDAALGREGEVYLATNGTCAVLFTGCPAALAEHPLIALDVRRTGEPIQRLLLPETEGPEAEGIPTLVYENNTSSLFVVWESKAGTGHSRINLVWLRAGVWSDVVELTGDVSPLKGVPQVAITRDAYELRSPEGGAARRERTTLHVAWWEKGSLLDEVYYTPIFIDNGAFIGQNRVYNLTSMDPSPLPATAVTLPAELQRTLLVAPGSGSDSVVIGLVNARTQRFLAFESHVVSGQLSSLGDSLTAMIAGSDPTDSPEDLAARIGAHVVEFGHRLHPALSSYLSRVASAETLAVLSDDPNLGLLGLGERIGAHVVEFGLRGTDDALSYTTVAGPLETTLETPSVMSSSPLAAHSIRLRLVRSAPAPTVGPHGPYWFVLSPDGKKAVASWQTGGSLRYRELEEIGWSGERTLDLTGPIDQERAEQILRQRVRDL